MGKRRSSGSSARALRVKRSAKSIPDEQIDFSDIPEFTDEELAQFRPLGRPLLGMHPRKIIAIRIDPGVLEAIKKEALEKGLRYQSLINTILAKHTRSAA
jgi:predicted DNA binding CopG/RHH family protein